MAVVGTNQTLSSTDWKILHYIVAQVTDYYTRAVEYNNTEGELKSAHDLHEGTKPSFDGQGEFSTDLYTRNVDLIIDDGGWLVIIFVMGNADQEGCGGDRRPPC